MKRYGNYIETSTGRQFWPLDPRPEDISITDIAAGLSKICRFNGQCREFYSVAAHSINCADMAGNAGAGVRLQLLLLLHDASEAYVSDIATPVKSMLPEYAAIEQGIMDAVYKQFNLLPPTVEEERVIKAVDTHALRCEAKRLMPMQCNWGDWVDGFDERHRPYGLGLPNGFIGIESEYSIPHIENLFRLRFSQFRGIYIQMMGK